MACFTSTNTTNTFYIKSIFSTNNFTTKLDDLIVDLKLELKSLDNERLDKISNF